MGFQRPLAAGDAGPRRRQPDAAGGGQPHGSRSSATDKEITFYGSSFIADHTGAKVAEADRCGEAVLTATFDLDALDTTRHAWGLFRDRRPDLYRPLLTLDGRPNGTVDS